MVSSTPIKRTELEIVPLFTERHLPYRLPYDWANTFPFMTDDIG
jgi:hypothetical protein